MTRAFVFPSSPRRLAALARRHGLHLAEAGLMALAFGEIWIGILRSAALYTTP